MSKTFIELCEINSPSKSERELALHLSSLFRELGAAEIIEDNSARETGSDSGNLVIRFAGNADNMETVFFNCHLDVISPCHNVKVKQLEDGLFTSSGDTVLGGDDKAGIAILLETIQSLQESNMSFGPFEVVLTTCEEIGLLGARFFNPELLSAPYGYSLDSTGVDNLIAGAPAAHSIDIDIFGIAAHAGLSPEKGINAIQLAGHVLYRFPVGRLDPESTANIGLINGGKAINIIPDFVNLQGEVRSHSRELLGYYLQIYQDICQQVIGNNYEIGRGDLPSFSFRCPEQYPLMSLSENQPVIQRALISAARLDRRLEVIRAGGGSDANFFNHFGVPTAILGVGMDHVHSTSEQIKLNDMLRTAELVGAILTP
ncbi:MAG: M20/M25/M40 family metallo-hydrolase [Thermodesulfobacteriota bacterium]